MLPAIHSLRGFRHALGVLLLFVLVSACAATSTQPTAGVTFIVPVPVEAFSPKTAAGQRLECAAAENTGSAS